MRDASWELALATASAFIDALSGNARPSDEAYAHRQLSLLMQDGTAVHHCINTLVLSFARTAKSLADCRGIPVTDVIDGDKQARREHYRAVMRAREEG
jgi:hypothetical protein